MKFPIKLTSAVTRAASGETIRSGFIYLGEPTKVVLAIHRKRSPIHKEVLFEVTKYFKRNS